MKKEDFFKVAGVIFVIAGLIHLIRSINSWDLVLGNYLIPLWVSYVLVIVTAYMAYWAFKFKR